MYSGCSDAAPKKKVAELSCPYILPEKSAFADGWMTVGNIPVDKLQIRSISIIDQDTSDISNRDFSEQVIDEWEDFPDRSESIADYDENHGNLMIKCVYAKSYNDVSDSNTNNVILLIPIPSNKPVVCTLVNRKISPEFELFCKVK